MDSLFQKFMTETEAAGLSEGDYLKACNALKQAFEAAKLPTTTPAQTPEDARIAQRRPLDIKIHNLNEENDCHFTFELEIKEYCIIRGHHPNEVRVSYNIDKDGSCVKRVEDKYMGHTELCNLIHQLMLASQTQTLYFKSECLGTIWYDLEPTLKYDSELEKKISRVYENDDGEDVVFDNDSFANIMRSILGSLLHQHYTTFA